VAVRGRPERSTITSLSVIGVRSHQVKIKSSPQAF
jgi:hypothetical protein